MTRVRGIQNKWRESDMEYIEELESLKSEITKSGERIENLSGLMENFSDITKLRQAIKEFREDNIFGRIESKIDIIAQSDSTEIINLIISELNEDINSKYEDISTRITSLEELNSQIMSALKNQPVIESPVEEKSEDLSEIKESIETMSSNYKYFLENLNNIQKTMTEFKNGNYKDKNIEEFTGSIKASIVNMEDEAYLKPEEKLDNLTRLLKVLGNGFLSSVSSLDSKLSGVNEKLLSFDNLDDNFESIRQKLDILTRTLKTSGIQGLEKVSYFNEDTAGLETRISNEIKENLGEFKENLSGLQEEMGKISLAIQQKGNDTEITKKLENLIHIVDELKEGVNSNNSIAEEENSENINQILQTVKTLPQQEFLLEKLATLAKMYNEIRLNLDNDTLEEEVKEGFSVIENNFAKIEELLANISSFEQIREDISKLNNNVEQIKNQINDNSETPLILENLDKINGSINKMAETLPEKTTYEGIKDSFTDLSSKVFDIQENLYPLKNLQTLNETFESAQEKLSIILENLDENNIENFNKTLNLDARFENVHSQMDEKITNRLNTVTEKLTEIINSSQEINNEVKNEIDKTDHIKSDVKYLNLKADGLKELLDRLIRFSGSVSGKSENNFEEVKNGLTFLNKELTVIKESIYKRVDKEDFTEKVDVLNNLLTEIQDKVNDTAETDEFKDLLNSIKEEVNNGFKTEVESSEKTTDEIKHLTLKADGLKELLDRLIKFSGSVSGQSENHFQEMKKGLSFLYDQVGLIKEEITHAREKAEADAFPEELKERLYDLENLKTLNESFQSTQEKLNILLETVNNKNAGIIDEETETNPSEDIKVMIDQQVLSGLADLKECLRELQEKQSDSEEIESALDFLKHGLEDISASLKYSKENDFSEKVLKVLLKDVNLIKDSINQESAHLEVNKIGEQISNLDSKITELQEMSQFNENTNFIKAKLCELEEKFNYTNEKLDEFTNFTHNNSNTESYPVNNELQSIDRQLCSKFEANAELLNEFLNEVSSKIDDLQNNKDDINYLKENLTNILEKSSTVTGDVSGLCEEVHLLKDIQEKVENINNQMGTASSNEELTELNNKIDSLTDEIRSYKENVSSIQHIPENQDFSELLTKFNEINETISNYSENTDSGKLDNIENKISDEFSSLNDTIFEVKNRIETLNESLDNLKGEGESGEFGGKLEIGLDEIKNFSTEISREISGLKSSVSDLFESINLSNDSEKEWQERERLEKAVERAELALNESRPDFDELIDSSRNLSEKIEKISSDVSGLSEENRDKLGKFLDLSRNIESKINDSSSNTDKILEAITKISELSENQITAASETIYDLKKDFSALSEDLSGFNNDVIDISSKLNKLILNTNDNTGALKEKITNSFDNLKEELNRNLKSNSLITNKATKHQINGLSKELSEIYQKIEKLNSLSVKGLNSTDTLRDAVVQMAEWIDSASSLLEENNNNIKKNLTNTDNLMDAVSDSQKNVIDQVNKVYTKFEDFEIRLESIEAKIEKVCEQQNNYEVKNMLLEIIEKVSDSNNYETIGIDRSNELVLNKMEQFENKMQKILDSVEQ